MRQQLLTIICLLTLLVGLGSVRAAEKLTTPPESLNGLRPGTLTVADLTKQFGDPAVTDTGGLLGLYGGAENSALYGWFMVENPNYTVPDLAVETAKGSNRVDLVMAIGYDGLKTKKDITCFNTEDEMLDAYGRPDYVFAVPMQGYTLREFYYVNQGISFDVAPIGPNSARQIIAIYVTYPEYLKGAIQMRRDFIREGTGSDVTAQYQGVST